MKLIRLDMNNMAGSIFLDENMKQSPRNSDFDNKIFSDSEDLESLPGWDHQNTDSIFSNINDRKRMDTCTQVLFAVLLLTTTASLSWVILDGMTFSTKSLFQFHVLFGVLFGFVLYPFAAIIFRYFTNITKPTAKVMHGVIMGFLTLLMVVTGGIMYQAKESAKLPHSKTMHDWLSIAVIIIMVIQLIVAIITFSFDIVPIDYKIKIREIHANMGILVLVLLLLGLVYALGRIFSKPKGTTVVFLGNLTGIFCIIGTLLTTYILTEQSYQRKNAKID